MRRRRLKQLIRELTGRSEAEFVHVLEGQVSACLDGAEVAYELSRGTIDSADARQQMLEIEHRGDEKRAQLVEQLSRALVTPIDREDLFRVSRSIDDVLDNLRDYVLEVDLFEAAGDTDLPTELTGKVIEAIDLLQVAVISLIEERHEVGRLILDAKKAGGVIRLMYQHAVAELLGDKSSEADFRSTMRRRELLRRLDVVGLRLGEASDALADALIKRSY